MQDTLFAATILCTPQGEIRFSVFDENEEDTEAALGFASLPLTELQRTNVAHKELQLVDIHGEPAGSLSLSIELQHTTQPKPIHLRRAGAGREKSNDPDYAALMIQSHFRGRKVRKHGGPQSAAEPAAPLVVSVHRLRLSPEVQPAGTDTVWVEVDMLGLHSEALRSKRLKARDADREVQGS